MDIDKSANIKLSYIAEFFRQKTVGDIGPPSVYHTCVLRGLAILMRVGSNYDMFQITRVQKIRGAFWAE